MPLLAKFQPRIYSSWSWWQFGVSGCALFFTDSPFSLCSDLHFNYLNFFQIFFCLLSELKLAHFEINQIKYSKEPLWVRVPPFEEHYCRQYACSDAGSIPPCCPNDKTRVFGTWRLVYLHDVVDPHLSVQRPRDVETHRNMHSENYQIKDIILFYGLWLWVWFCVCVCVRVVD